MIKYIENPEERKKIIKDILSDLPEWFDSVESIEFCNNGKDMVMIAYFIENEAVGFLSLNPHNSSTIEVYVLGVKKSFHKHGIGHKLMNEAIDFSKKHGYKLMEVKTVDESGAACYKSYAVTREYYESLGFLKVEKFPEFWDQDCPCLLLIKPIN